MGELSPTVSAAKFVAETAESAEQLQRIQKDANFRANACELTLSVLEMAIMMRLVIDMIEIYEAALGGDDG